MWFLFFFIPIRLLILLNSELTAPCKRDSVVKFGEFVSKSDDFLRTTRTPRAQTDLLDLMGHFIIWRLFCQNLRLLEVFVNFIGWGLPTLTLVLAL